MLLIYFVLGLGITTAHSDYGVSFRAQNFDKTVRNIDKESYVRHQREKRFATGSFVPQNVTNRLGWGTNSSKNTTGFTHTLGPYGNTTDVTEKYVNPGQNYNKNLTWPVYPTYNYIQVIPSYTGKNTSNPSGYNIPANSATPRNTPYPGYPGYPAPNTRYTAQNTGYPGQNNGYSAQATGYPAQNTGYPARNTGYPASNSNPVQTYNANVTRPAYPNYNNTNVRPANINNSNPSGYNILPVKPVTPGNTPNYPVPNTGYAVSNTGDIAPNTWYPASSTGYPAPNTGYPASNTGYRAPNTGYPASSGYPVTNTFYPPPRSSSVIPPTNVTRFVTKPNPGFTIHDGVPRNNSNGFNNNGNGFNNNGNGFNNTASLASCNIKCNRRRQNSTITKEERAMDACAIACNNCPTGMRMSALGVCVQDLDYDDEY